MWLTEILPEIFLTDDEPSTSASVSTAVVAENTSETNMDIDEEILDGQAEDEEPDQNDDEEADENDDDFKPRRCTISMSTSTISMRSNSSMRFIDASSNTDDGEYVPAIPLREGRKIREEVLLVICRICIAAKISINAALLAFAEAAQFFNQNYKLSAVFEDDEMDEEMKQVPKKLRSLSKATMPLYANILPSYRSVFLFKHAMALAAEKNASIQLLHKLDNAKCVILFDFTARRGLKGEWPAPILMIGEKK